MSKRLRHSQTRVDGLAALWLDSVAAKRCPIPIPRKQTCVGGCIDFEEYPVMKAWSVIGLLFTAAILASIPISPQVTPRGVELSVDQAQATAE